jgi:hypothetical protein
LTAESSSRSGSTADVSSRTISSSAFRSVACRAASCSCAPRSAGPAMLASAVNNAVSVSSNCPVGVRLFNTWMTPIT